MWKVLLAWFAHRTFLLVVSYCTLTFFSAQPHPSFWPAFSEKISQTSEVQFLEQHRKSSLSEILKVTKNPFLVLSHLLCSALGFTPLAALLLASTVFFLLFLSEIYALSNRMVTQEVSVLTSILVLLWPTSYEWGLGSSLSFSSWLWVGSLRLALDSKWGAVGLFLSLLMFADPIAVAGFAILGFVFWAYERHEPKKKMVQNGLVAFGPALLVFLFFSGWPQTGIDQVVQKLSSGDFSWFFSKENSGQSLTLAFFLLGGTFAFASNSTFVYRFLPIASVIAWITFSPFETLASRASYAALSMQGIALVSARHTAHIIIVMLTLLGAYEVYSVFY